MADDTNQYVYDFNPAFKAYLGRYFEKLGIDSKTADRALYDRVHSAAVNGFRNNVKIADLGFGKGAFPIAVDPGFLKGAPTMGKDAGFPAGLFGLDGNADKNDQLPILPYLPPKQDDQESKSDEMPFFINPATQKQQGLLPLDTIRKNDNPLETFLDGLLDLKGRNKTAPLPGAAGDSRPVIFAYQTDPAQAGGFQGERHITTAEEAERQLRKQISEGRYDLVLNLLGHSRGREALKEIGVDVDSISEEAGQEKLKQERRDAQFKQGLLGAQAGEELPAGQGGQPETGEQTTSSEYRHNPHPLGNTKFLSPEEIKQRQEQEARDAYWLGERRTEAEQKAQARADKYQDVITAYMKDVNAELDKNADAFFTAYRDEIERRYREKFPKGTGDFVTEGQLGRNVRDPRMMDFLDNVAKQAGMTDEEISDLKTRLLEQSGATRPTLGYPVSGYRSFIPGQDDNDTMNYFAYANEPEHKALELFDKIAEGKATEAEIKSYYDALQSVSEKARTDYLAKYGHGLPDVTDLASWYVISPFVNNAIGAGLRKFASDFSFGLVDKYYRTKYPEMYEGIQRSWAQHDVASAIGTIAGVIFPTGLAGKGFGALGKLLAKVFPALEKTPQVVRAFSQGALSFGTSQLITDLNKGVPFKEASKNLLVNMAVGGLGDAGFQALKNILKGYGIKEFVMPKQGAPLPADVAEAINKAAADMADNPEAWEQLYGTQVAPRELTTQAKPGEASAGEGGVKGYDDFSKSLLGEAGIEGEGAKGAGVPGQYTEKIKWGIFDDIEVRPAGKGYFGKRIPQSDPRVDAYELKINPNNESYYLPLQDGSYVQFENMVNDVVQDGKLIMDQKSFYHVYDMPDFAKNGLLLKAKRQIKAAKNAGYTVEWLVSDQEAVSQLTEFFREYNIDIAVTYLPE